MKCFFLIEWLKNSAGTERIATDVANGIFEMTNWEIEFITLSDDVTSFFPLLPGIKVRSINGKISKPLQASYKLRKLITKEKPDYVINVATTMSRISIPAAAFTSTKVISWDHFNLYSGSKLGYIWRLCSALFSTRTIVLTNKDRENYPRLLQHKINTIYNFPTPIKGKISNLDSKIAIAVGRLTYQKGFDLLLSSWAKVCQTNKEWTLYIIGSGKDENKLKEQAHRLHIINRVKFIPPTNQISEYYAQASLYIMSSRFEGFGLVLIEAKQQGLPCISFDCPNGPNEIIRSGIDGIIIPMNDIQGMANEISLLINNRSKIKSFGKEALADMKERFNKENIIKKWIQILSQTN